MTEVGGKQWQIQKERSLISKSKHKIFQNNFCRVYADKKLGNLIVSKTAKQLSYMRNVLSKENHKERYFNIL